MLERLSLEGICRIFEVSMPWLLNFMQQKIQELPDNLNTTQVVDSQDLAVFNLQLDEMWSFVGKKKNKQWLWIALDVKSRQILSFHVGKRTKLDGKNLLSKIPESVKKKPNFIQTIFQYTQKLSHSNNTDQLVKNQGKQIIVV